MPCPLCRQEFTIPASGLAAIQKSFIMEKLLSASRRSAGEELRHGERGSIPASHDLMQIDLRSQVKRDGDMISQLLEMTEGVLPRLKKEKAVLMNRLGGIERKIDTAADKLIATVERDRVKLLSEVESIKLKRVKQLETVKQEVEQQVAALKSLKQYSETLLSCGTACDVTKSASSLHSRAEELMMFDVIGHVDNSIPSMNVCFTSSTLPNVDNLVGTVTEEGLFRIQSVKDGLYCVVYECSQYYSFIIDHVAGEIIRLVASVCVCPSVCLWALSSLNRLSFDLGFWHEGRP